MKAKHLKLVYKCSTSNLGYIHPMPVSAIIRMIKTDECLTIGEFLYVVNILCVRGVDFGY